jgi:hypothetical protein
VCALHQNKIPRTAVMSRAARLRIALVIAVVLVAVIVVGLPVLADWRSAQAFARIKQGDGEKLVTMYMGYAAHSGGCGTQLRWDDDSLGANDGRCVKEVRYDGRRGAWMVGYSANGQVISKYFEAAH